MPCAFFPIAYRPLPIAALPTLAQSKIDPRIWIYFLILLIVLVIGAVVIFTLRGKLLGSDDPHTAGGGLMDQLDQMRRSGKISDEEYEMTRRAIIDKAVEMNQAKDGPARDRASTPPDQG